MPRRLRVFIEGGVYHVHNRFARGADVLREGDEADRFLELLTSVKKRDGLTVFAWCLMSNHYHLALRSGPVPLARTMGYLQSCFGQSYNRRHRSTGPLWQSRYKAKLVEDEGYLRQLVAYVHLNPVTAGVVDDPAGYALSGHLEVVGKRPASMVDTDEVLGLYGETVRAARSAYVRTLRGLRDQEWIGERPGGLPWWRREPDRPVEPAGPEVYVDEQGRSTGLDRPSVEPGVFVEHAAVHLGVTTQELRARASNRTITATRCLITALAVERWRLRSGQLGAVLGRRPEVVGRWARWGAERRLDDAGFRERYDELDQAMARSLAASP